MAGAPLQPLLADLGIVPVVVFWVVMMLVARAKKQQKQEQASRPPVPSASSPEQRAEPRAPQVEGGLLVELRRAMEELKRAESQTAPPRPSTQGNAQALARLEQKKQEAARRRAARQQQQAQRLPMGAAGDQSSEGESLENTDYDNEAERVVATRRQAAERRVREDLSVEELSDQQRARRASRTDIAIGGAAEHDAWHHEIGGAAESAVKPRVSPLRRFADGTPRSAVLLSMILGPPFGLDQDG